MGAIDEYTWAMLLALTPLAVGLVVALGGIAWEWRAEARVQRKAMRRVLRID